MELMPKRLTPRSTNGITVVCNLHTLDTARRYCDRIVGMAAGRVVFDGLPAELSAATVREIYGVGGDGAAVDEDITSTSLDVAGRRATLHRVAV